MESCNNPSRFLQESLKNPSTIPQESLLWNAFLWLWNSLKKPSRIPPLSSFGMRPFGMFLWLWNLGDFRGIGNVICNGMKLFLIQLRYLEQILFCNSFAIPLQFLCNSFGMRFFGILETSEELAMSYAMK